MQVKNLMVQDYSTGTEYRYGDQSGTWGSIVAVGGHVNGGPSNDVDAPQVTSTSSGQPIPFRPDTSSYVRPTVYPWVPEASTLATAVTPTYTNYPGLPSGWTVSDSGKVIPPSSAPVRKSLRLFDERSLLT